MQEDREIRLTRAAMAAYASAKGHDATTPWEEILEEIKVGINKALSEPLGGPCVSTS